MANMVYNNYKNYRKEVEFTQLYPEFPTRADALQHARALKSEAMLDIGIGTATSLVSAYLGHCFFKKIFHKKPKP